MNIWDSENAATNNISADGASALTSLPYAKPHVFSAMQSSYDRLGGNADGFHGSNYLYTDTDGNQVLLDVEGSGAVKRIWIAGEIDFKTVEFKIYIDDNRFPVLAISAEDMFRTRNKPFVYPLVMQGAETSGGGISYVQIPFEKSIKITANVFGKGLFYQINYESYTDGVSVSKWDANSVDDALADFMLSSAKFLDEGFKGETVTRESTAASIPAGSRVNAVALEGSGCVQSLRMNLTGDAIKTKQQQEQALTDLWIHIYCDETDKVAIRAPIASFFGIGNVGKGRALGIAAGESSGTLYFRLPMPYRDTLIVEIENTSDSISYLCEIELEFDVRPVADYELTLKGRYTQYDCAAYDGTDYIVLEERGTGHVVGIVQTFYGSSDRNYLEGDERIYIDDSLTPVIHGTGTEDIYNGSGYFWNGPFTQPFGGNTAHTVREELDITTCYRYYITDPIVFRKSIVYGIEHGADLNWKNITHSSVNSKDVRVESLVFYYHTPEESMERTDFLCVTEPEQRHNYSNDSAFPERTVISAFEGNYENRPMVKQSYDIAGNVTFHVKIRPDNHGIMIRRTFDQTEPCQAVEVYADDEYAGIWRSTMNNKTHKLRQDEFLLPSSLTKGKDAVTVRLTNIGIPHWNEMEYEVYSFINPVKGGKVNDIELSGDMGFEEIEIKPQSVIRRDEQYCSVSGNSVIITARPDENFATVADMSNIVLLDAVQYDNFIFRCRMQANIVPDANYMQAGIMLYENDTNFLRAGRIYSFKNQFDFSAMIDKMPKSQRVDDPIGADTVWLSIVKTRSLYSAYCSLDGVSYTRISTYYDFPNNPLQSANIALFCSLGSAVQKDFSVVFDNFRLFAVPDAR